MGLKVHTSATEHHFFGLKWWSVRATSFGYVSDPTVLKRRAFDLQDTMYDICSPRIFRGFNVDELEDKAVAWATGKYGPKERRREREFTS